MCYNNGRCSLALRPPWFRSAAPALEAGPAALHPGPGAVALPAVSCGCVCHALGAGAAWALRDRRAGGPVARVGDIRFLSGGAPPEGCPWPALLDVGKLVDFPPTAEMLKC